MNSEEGYFPKSRRWSLAEVVKTEAGRTLLRRQMEAIAVSAAFKGSERSRDFLEAVVQIASAGEEVKERTLGVEVFGRPATYDTTQDPIVRSTAKDVRRRLASYYREAGRGELYSIYLPSGGYLPELRIRQSRSGAPAEDAPWARFEAKRSVRSQPEPKRGTKRGWILAFCAFVLSLMGFAVRLSRSASSENTREALLSRPNDLVLVASDPQLAEGSPAGDHPIDISEYIRSTRNQVSAPAGQEPASGEPFPRRPVIFALDAELMVETARLVGSKRQVRGVAAQDLKANSFLTTNDFVLFGNTITNPWLSMFNSSSLDFRYEIDASARTLVIVNSRPLQGEGDHYGPKSVSDGISETYALVTLLKERTSDTRILLLGGLAPESDLAAAQLFMDPNRWAKSLGSCKHVGGTGPSFIQVLLQAKIIAGVPDSVQSVACHLRP